MQDPERVHPEQPDKTAMTPTEPQLTASGTIQEIAGEERLSPESKEPAQPRAANRGVVLQSLGEAIRNLIEHSLERGGRALAEINGEVTILAVRAGETVMRIVEKPNSIDAGIVVKKHKPEGPFKGVHRERDLNKARIAWPSKWPTENVTVFYNKQQGERLKLIITNDARITPPTGWISVGTLTIQTAPNGSTRRACVPIVFGLKNNRDESIPKKLDMYGHSGFLTVVPSGQQDLNDIELMETGIPQDIEINKPQ